MAGETNPSQWEPHAERQFAQFTHAIAKHLPRKMTELRRIGTMTRALPGQRRPKGRG